MNTPDLALKDLHAVLAVASHGHFGHAAAALNMAQPTLSTQVQRVESALQTQLFERAGRRFFITPEGERLIPLIRELLASAERLTAPPPTSSTPLRLGIIPTLGPYLIPHLLLPLRKAHPHLTLSLAEEPTARIIEHLLDGSLDVALLSLPIRADSLSTVPLFDEPFRLIAPRGSTILNLDPLAPANMTAGDMVLLEEGHCLRDQALALCGKRGGTTPRLLTTSLETLKYLVAAGEGYSLLPLLACEIPRGLASLVEVRSFDERAPSRRIALCYRKTLTRTAEVQTLAAFVRSNLPNGVLAISRPITAKR